MSDFSRFYALLKNLPYADKEMLVETYSNGKTTSLREFSKSDPRGFAYMLADMENNIEKLKGHKIQKPIDPDEPKKRRFRSLILKAMESQGVRVHCGDWSNVNDFVERYAGAGKSLSNMTLDELKRFNSQVHKLLDYYNMKREKALLIAIQN